MVERLLGIALVLIAGCGVGPTKKIVVDENTPRDGFCADGVAVGDIKKEVCPNGLTGEKILVCKAPGTVSEVVLDTCAIARECTKVTFQEHLLPVIKNECAKCHAPHRFGEYNVATSRINEFIRRINLGSNQQQRMPPPPEKELLPEQKKLFEQWRDDGFILDTNDCLEGQNGWDAPTSLNYLESALIKDANRIDADDRFFIRWLTALHRNGEDVKVARQAIEKTLNSLVFDERDIVRVTEVDPRGVWRIDIRSYEMDRDDWEDIEGSEPFDIISNTDSGRVLRLLTSSRKPWMHYENFIDTVNVDAELYYDLLGIETNVDKSGTDFLNLAERLGVDYEQDLIDREAMLAGFNGSPISLNKPRMVSRHKSRNGAFHASYDVSRKNVNDPDANLFARPLLAETGSNKVFAFDAGEVIFTLANGLLGYFLGDANGDRQNFAPTDIVQDGISPVFPHAEITAPVSCHRCHSYGYIPVIDQVRAKVLANAVNFDRRDLERVAGTNQQPGLYKPQASIDALFRVDNNVFAQALAKIDILPTDNEPISAVRDFYRSDWDLKKVAAFFMQPEVRMLDLINRSTQIKEDIGQLLSGGTITFDQLVNVTPDILGLGVFDQQ